MALRGCGPSLSPTSSSAPSLTKRWIATTWLQRTTRSVVIRAVMPHLHRNSAHPCLPHRLRDRAHAAHICTGTGPAPSASAPGPSAHPPRAAAIRAVLPCASRRLGSHCASASSRITCMLQHCVAVVRTVSPRQKARKTSQKVAAAAAAATHVGLRRARCTRAARCACWLGRVRQMRVLCGKGCRMSRTSACPPSAAHTSGVAPASLTRSRFAPFAASARSVSSWHGRPSSCQAPHACHVAASHATGIGRSSWHTCPRHGEAPAHHGEGRRGHRPSARATGR